MNKLVMSLPKLIKELQMIEGILKDPKGVHIAIKDSSSSFYNKKKNYFKKSKQRKNKAKEGKSKGKGKCFICGKKGYWKKECFDFLKKNEGMSH